MRLLLILCLAFTSTVCGAANAASPAAQQFAQVMGPVAGRPLPVSPSAAAPRHLSDGERAELRRQLYQFNRQYGSRRP